MKTAVLIQGACKSGAVIAHADIDNENALSQYGYHLGIAFQMADDLLDYTADLTTLGKKPGADIREGKLTLPLIFALSKANEKDRQYMEKIIQDAQLTNEDFNEFIAMLHKYRGIEYTELKARDHVKKAKENLEIFKQSEARDVMMMLADYAIARDV